MHELTDLDLSKCIEADSNYEETRQQYVDKMTELGYKIYYPENNELLIDIDTKEQYEQFKAKFSRLVKEFEDTTYSIIVSKSGYPHQHIIVKMGFDLNNSERIALQAILGSDPIREMLSLFRHFNVDPFPSLLALKGD